MSFHSSEKAVQVVIALLKAHGIRNVIASPGTTNAPLVVSIQDDPDFKVYSSVDERSAAYIACGLAAETGSPVVLSCTGATASRNYLPGLTEAYYRKLPILAITSTQDPSKVGHHIAQIVDRSSIQNDVAKLSVSLPLVKDDDDLWECEVKTNNAILELTRHGGGPVHINLPTSYSRAFENAELPAYRVIERVCLGGEFPALSGNVAVFVGAHKKWSEAETEALDHFCSSNNAVVLCDHTSGYRGKYRLLYALAAGQETFDRSAICPDVLIHIGEISGDYESIKIGGKQVWRVSPDGEIRDPFRKLQYVFEMEEVQFFKHYSRVSPSGDSVYFEGCRTHLEYLRSRVPELPFSNLWVASRLAPMIPRDSTIHFGILNSLRSWNFFELPPSVTSSSNVGGFGIDGGLSALVGASLADENRLCFMVIGDLAFFYDMNVLGNRHVGKNLRIMLVNNGKGAEFTQYNHYAALFGDKREEYIAAAGHFGNKSPALVRHYAQDLGFEYLSASDKSEFERVYERFVAPEIGVPVLFEVFTDSGIESDALEAMKTIQESAARKVKEAAKGILGKARFDAVKRLIKS